MSVQADREFAAYRKFDHDARAILDRADEEQRATTAEEDEQYERLATMAEQHRKRADQLAKTDREAAELESQLRSIGLEAGTFTPSAGGERQTTDYDRLVSLMRDTQNAYHGGEKRTEVGFDAETRAIADFSDSGSLYVSEFATNVAVYARTATPWLRTSTIRTSANGRPLIIPNISADPTSYTPGEGTAITESTPTFGTATATLVGYKGLAYVSMEADEDAMYDVMPYISQTQGRSIGLAFGGATTVAILAAATNGGTATGLGGGSTATFVGLEDLWDLKLGRAEPYRSSPNSGWVMSNGLIKKAKKYRDLNGQYLWSSSTAAGLPPTFDGDPVYEDPYLATPASATKSVLYGDLGAVLVKQVPLRFAVSTEYRFNTDQLALKAVLRAAAALPDAKAIAYLVSADS